MLSTPSPHTCSVRRHISTLLKRAALALHRSSWRKHWLLKLGVGCMAVQPCTAMHSPRCIGFRPSAMPHPCLSILPAPAREAATTPLVVITVPSKAKQAHLNSSLGSASRLVWNSVSARKEAK